MTLQELAAEASSYFETRERSDGSRFVALKDDRPAWLQELAYEAHGDFMPDDWRYACIAAAVESIAESEDAEDESSEFADSQVDIYTGSRLQWLASNLNRLGYTDDACEEYGAETLDTAERIGLGQYAEASEVYSLVLDALQVRAEEIEDEERALNVARAESQARFPLDLAARLEWIRQKEHDADNAEDRAVWTRLAEEVRGQ